MQPNRARPVRHSRMTWGGRDHARAMASWLRVLVVMCVALMLSCGSQREAPAAPDPERILVVPMTVHVATSLGAPVVRDAQIVAAVRRANRALAPHRMRVEVTRVRTMSPGHTVISGQAQRLRLAQHAAADGTLHVFFVRRVTMREGDIADARLSGLHWRYDGLRSHLHEREFLVVAEDAPNTTLAHEIGHALGLEHHRSEENIMCSCRKGPDTYFSGLQGQAMRVGAAEWLARAGSTP